jgi:hypothetical protein
MKYYKATFKNEPQKGHYGIISYDGKEAYLLARSDVKDFKPNNVKLSKSNWEGWRGNGLAIKNISKNEADKLIFVERL